MGIVAVHRVDANYQANVRLDEHTLITDVRSVMLFTDVENISISICDRHLQNHLNRLADVG